MSSEPLNSPPPPTMPLTKVLGVVVLGLPAAVLLLAILRSSGSPNPILAGGLATSAFLAAGLLHQVGAKRALSHKLASPLYLISVLILWTTTRDYNNSFMQWAMGALLGIPVTMFVVQEYLFTGQGTLKKARYLAWRLANRTEWPNDLVECKFISEVKALRGAIRDDAEPVMTLLAHPKPHVRIAALATLEFRPTWRPGQPQEVLQAAKFATEPPVRAAALTALANVDEPFLVSAMAVYLRDASPEVRRAAAEALLWDSQHRWNLMRSELRGYLSDSRCRADGPLPCPAGLPNQALTDLTMWSGETGTIGVRSTLTLLTHYRRELNQNPGSDLAKQLSTHIGDNRFPSMLRVEIAHLLVREDCIEPEFWFRLLESSQPSALRLLAAGALLNEGENEQALATLREIAALPNREIAIRVAAILQKCLRIDMGLPLSGPLPEPTSKQAAEIARRVTDWANGKAPSISTRRTRLTSMARQIPRPTGENPRRPMS